LEKAKLWLIARLPKLIPTHLGFHPGSVFNVNQCFDCQSTGAVALSKPPEKGKTNLLFVFFFKVEMLHMRLFNFKIQPEIEK